MQLQPWCFGLRYTYADWLGEFWQREGKGRRRHKRWELFFFFVAFLDGFGDYMNGPWIHGKCMGI